MAASSRRCAPSGAKTGILPRPHGSAVFTRGQTQVLTTVTLGAMGDVQILDGISPEESKRYMHHYNFPPYSTAKPSPCAARAAAKSATARWRSARWSR